MKKNYDLTYFLEKNKKEKNLLKKNLSSEPLLLKSNVKNKVTSYKKNIYSSPTVINLEITEACNVKCLHCYNPWREEHAGRFSLENDRIDYLINEFEKNKVFHVILSGGEPLAKFKLLCYAIENLIKKNISISLNSNLMLASDNKMSKLKKLGLDHVLTSWFSYYPNETDKITTYKNSHQKIIDGIKTTVKNGIRVSANTICTQHNKGTIYNSGKFLNSIGVSQFFAHRVIPPAYDRNDEQKQHFISIADAKESLDELLRLKEDTGMAVGTLINYPLCMLGDLEKYSDFVGRGCPTQSGHRFNINSSGDTHGCVMEEKDYGNVFEIGLKEAYRKTLSWRDESYLFDGCKKCHYIDICHSGCRMHAFSDSGKMNGKDPLMPGKEFIVKPFKFKNNKKILVKIKNGARMAVPKTIRFRKEKNFYLLNIRWGNTIEVTNYEGKFLMKIQENNSNFIYNDFKVDNNLERLSFLISKGALSSKEINITVKKTGVNLDPIKLPNLKNNIILENHPNLKI